MRAPLATTPLAAALVRGLVRGFTAGQTKRCPQCNALLPIADFMRNDGHVLAQCGECRARYSNWKNRTPEERLAARRPVARTGNGYTVNFTLRSGNRKVGPIPVSTTDMRSCPTSCPHLDAGCYASYGVMSYHWSQVPVRGYPWAEFCDEISRLPPRTLWRHNDAGDLPGLGDRLDRGALLLLVEANIGRRGFTFTHKPLTERSDRHAIARANAMGFRVNLSADNLEHADARAKLGIGPVAVVLPEGTTRPTKTPSGRHVVVCPAVTSDLTCATCGLCAKERKAIVGFPAHGQASRLVTLRARRLPA